METAGPFRPFPAAPGRFPPPAHLAPLGGCFRKGSLQGEPEGRCNLPSAGGPGGRSPCALSLAAAAGCAGTGVGRLIHPPVFLQGRCPCTPPGDLQSPGPPAANLTWVLAVRRKDAARRTVAPSSTQRVGKVLPHSASPRRFGTSACPSTPGIGFHVRFDAGVAEGAAGPLSRETEGQRPSEEKQRSSSEKAPPAKPGQRG
jgi:hypothetical protein